MIEIYKNLYIGNQNDFEFTINGKPDWFVVQACKDPYHRQALGYLGRGAPKDHPEYLIASRENRLILNLVDANNPDYFPKIIFDTALKFIDEKLKNENKVLVHCNKGESRSPGIGLLYLAFYSKTIPNDSLEIAETFFKEIYPLYNPSLGMQGFLKNNWDSYRSQ